MSASVPPVTHILILDDDPADRLIAKQTIKQLAKQTGLRIVVSAADNAEDALSLSEHIDIAIVDLGLPGMGGREAAQLLTETGAVVVIWSGNYAADLEPGDVQKSGGQTAIRAAVATALAFHQSTRRGC